MRNLFPLFFDPAVETPVGKEAETKPEPKAKEPVTEVEVDGQTFKVADLVAAARHAAFLEQHVNAMIDPGTPEGRRRESTKALLLLKHEPEAVEEYLKQMEGDAQSPEPKKEPRVKPNERDPMAEELERVKAELAKVQESQVSTRHRYLQDTLNAQIEQNVSKGDLAKLVERVREVKGAEVADAFVANLKKDAYSEATNRLGARSRTTGRFDEAWLGEAAAEAAKELATKYRPVIVDPSLGRAPETDAGEEAFLSQKPLDPPKYVPGMDPSAAEGKVKEWAADTLMRAHFESAGAGATKA